jgi:hypothetical protein
VISEFEARLADVLGARLPAPFGGRVRVAPELPEGTGPAVLVSASEVEVIDPDFSSARRPERVPGAEDPRRVLRARCAVRVEVLPGSGEGRAQQVEGLDAALYGLDAPDVRDGSALAADGSDPGFLIQHARVTWATAPAEPKAEDAERVAVTMLAEGWFWPVGVAGETGREIGEVRLRQGVLPLDVLPASPRPVAGGPGVELTVRLRGTGTLRLRGEPGPGPALPFGELALALAGPGGRPGAGTLEGGAAGADGVRLVPLGDGEASVTYVPPAEPGLDELVVALDDGAGGQGIELGRMPLRVGASE